MSNSAVRAGLRLMIFSVAASYILMRVWDITGSALPDEHFYAAQTVLLISAWVSGLLAAGGFIFAPSKYSGICKIISKLTGAGLSAGTAFLAAWAVAQFGGAGIACHVIFHCQTG